MLLAGLAELDAHIHQPRGEAMAGAADHLGIGGQALAIDPGTDLDDAALDGEEAAFLIAPARRIDEARIHQSEWALTVTRHRHPRWRGACGSADRGRPCAR